MADRVSETGFILEADITAREWNVLYEAPAGLYTIAIQGAEGWAAGQAGESAYLSGARWSRAVRIGQPSDYGPLVQGIRSLAVSPEGLKIVAGSDNGGAYERNVDRNWTPRVRMRGLSGIAAINNDRLIAVGPAGPPIEAAISDAVWRPMSISAGVEFTDVASMGDKVVASAHDGSVWLSSGHTWQTIGHPTECPLRSISVSANGDSIWVMGEDYRSLSETPQRTCVARYVAGIWELLWDEWSLSTSRPRDIAALDAGSAWLVRADGAWLFDQNRWSKVSNENLKAIGTGKGTGAWAASPDSFYYWDGLAWTRDATTSPSPGSMAQITEIIEGIEGSWWAVGYRGVVWYRDRDSGWRLVRGITSQVMSYGSANLLSDIIVTETGDDVAIWAVGDPEVVLRGTVVHLYALFVPQVFR
jgi:hypothetical protein